MKTILLLVHADPGQEARLRVAIHIARAINGHLACLEVAPLGAMEVGVLTGYDIARGVLDGRSCEAENRSTLTARLSREDVSWSWTDAAGDMASVILAAADLADLIILSRALETARSPDMRAIASRIVMRSGAAVLAVPEMVPRFALDRALVAWDGGISAASALRAAIPLLNLAAAVEILSVSEGGATHDPQRAAAYLAHHGIRAGVKSVLHGMAPADTRIIEESVGWHADYVVMGAFGRGRLMESFGGVTRRMLQDSRVPLLLHH